ncbi:hypothetical protein GY45DRAFT_433867 [Cubamyces sp. BRFM 1775]|nr:hypothetical protein GY45DRAFT_433867 [Cubamyces sp. BRFM 1775]
MHACAAGGSPRSGLHDRVRVRVRQLQRLDASTLAGEQFECSRARRAITASVAITLRPGVGPMHMASGCYNRHLLWMLGARFAGGERDEEKNEAAAFFLPAWPRRGAAGARDCMPNARGPWASLCRREHVASWDCDQIALLRKHDCMRVGVLARTRLYSTLEGGENMGKTAHEINVDQASACLRDTPRLFDAVWAGLRGLRGVHASGWAPFGKSRALSGQQDRAENRAGVSRRCTNYSHSGSEAAEKRRFELRGRGRQMDPLFDGVWICCSCHWRCQLASPSTTTTTTSEMPSAAVRGKRTTTRESRPRRP